MPRKKQIQTREDLIAELHKVYEEADKPADQIRALSAIAEIRGLKQIKGIGNLQGLQPDELEAIVREVVIPALEQFVVPEEALV